MVIKELGHTAFNVSDMEQALRFYCDVLGFKKAFTIRIPEDIAERMPGSPLVAMAGKENIVYLKISDGVFLELFYPSPYTNLESGGPNYDNIGYVHLCLVVDDLAVWKRHLRENNVQIDSDIHTGGDGTLTLWIRDPDGNRIEMMEYTENSLQIIYR